MDNGRVRQAVLHVREFAGELQGMWQWMDDAAPLRAARYARHRLIEELAVLEKVIDRAEYEESQEAKP